MDKNAKFSFEIYFSNGGCIKGEDFCIDIKDDNISDKDLADLIAEDFRNLKDGQIKILKKEILSDTR